MIGGTEGSAGRGRHFSILQPGLSMEKSQMHEYGGDGYYECGITQHFWVDLFTIDELPQQGSIHLDSVSARRFYGLAMGHRYKLDFGRYGVMGRICVWILSTVGD